ncbi:Sre G protein-coupled chemoreceptor [Trichostrongylus colubriformis]|uniref:Sre G protein-coupled chemoreceptor n=1 Tax=Trichostrongylus colubriformis TaxID=6319 RepID=A0AAN8J209_TRICO
MISLPGVVLVVRALGKSVQLFHGNLIRIMQVHLIAVTVSQISRISAVLYETKIIGGSEDSINALVFVTVAIRFASLCSLMTMIPAMITERIFASRFISDYEKLPRRWISALINSTAIVLAASYYALSMLACLSTFYIVGIVVLSVSIMSLSSVAIAMVYRCDVAILRDLANKTGVSQTTYTLSLKFQLQENVRVTKLLVVLSMCYSVWGFFGTCLCGLAFVLFDGTHPAAHLLYALFNDYVALSFAIFVWWLLSAIGDLRRILNTCFFCYCLLKKDVKRPNAVRQSVHRIDDYFCRLNSAWAP